MLGPCLFRRRAQEVTMETLKTGPNPKPAPVVQPTGLKVKTNVKAGPDLDVVNPR
jgi:hypothetical protein